MIFEVKQGNFSYNDKQVLKDINFMLKRGQTLSIMGPNGAGKTTLLKCMMGISKWNSGETLFDGKNIGLYTPKEFWKKTGYVPQIKNVVPGYTVMDMVLLGRSAHLGLLSLPSKKDYELAERAMEDVGIQNLRNEMCDCLSGGEMQLVLIARALCTDPQLLFLDEPESNLDFKNQKMVLEIIQKLAKEKNISVIFITHFPDHALEFSDVSILLQKDGENIFGKTSEVITPENLDKAF